MSRPRPWSALLVLASVAGCSPTGVDTSYGRSRGQSINGTAGLAELLRGGGHEVRTAIRFNRTLGDWADVLVRFAPYPGPPDRAEGDWMLGWLRQGAGRKVVYVACDHDSEPEFWARVIALQPKGTDPEFLARLERRRDQSKGWTARLRDKAKTPARAEDWFAVASAKGPPSACKSLGGPWADGVDPKAAAVPKHETLKADHDEDVLLEGDDQPLAMAWTLTGGSTVLALANGSFLLNAALLDKARRPLTLRVVDWIGPGPRRVAFIDGSNVLAPVADASSSPLKLLGVEPFGFVAAQLGAFGLLLCLALAATLGRPRAEPPSEAERPSAHPEALGALMARTGRADLALSMLETYRRWRHSSPSPGRKPIAPTPTVPDRAPLA